MGWLKNPERNRPQSLWPIHYAVVGSQCFQGAVEITVEPDRPDVGEVYTMYTWLRVVGGVVVLQNVPDVIKSNAFKNRHTVTAH